MAPIQFHQDLVAALGEYGVSYHIDRRWYLEFKYGREFCENKQTGEVSTTVTSEKKY